MDIASVITVSWTLLQSTFFMGIATVIPFLATLFVLNYFCFLWRFEKSGFDNVGSSFNEKHFDDDQVHVNLSKLNRRLIELSCSFSAGVLLAHALQDVMLTRGRAQCVGMFQAGQHRNKQTSTNENTACESVLHLGHADRLPCLLICIPLREYWLIDCLARSPHLLLSGNYPCPLS